MILVAFLYKGITFNMIFITQIKPAMELNKPEVRPENDNVLNEYIDIVAQSTHKKKNEIDAIGKTIQENLSQHSFDHLKAIILNLHKKAVNINKFLCSLTQEELIKNIQIIDMTIVFSEKLEQIQRGNLNIELDKTIEEVLFNIRPQYHNEILSFQNEKNITFSDTELKRIREGIRVQLLNLHDSNQEFKKNNTLDKASNPILQLSKTYISKGATETAKKGCELFHKNFINKNVLDALLEEIEEKNGAILEPGSFIADKTYKDQGYYIRNIDNNRSATVSPAKKDVKNNALTVSQLEEKMSFEKLIEKGDIILPKAFANTLKIIDRKKTNIQTHRESSRKNQDRKTQILTVVNKAPTASDELFKTQEAERSRQHYNHKIRTQIYSKQFSLGPSNKVIVPRKSYNSGSSSSFHSYT